MFIYQWIYESDRKYINPAIQRRESLDFHHVEVVRGVTLDRVLSRQAMSRIDIVWPREAAYPWPDRVIVTLTDGKKVPLQPINLDATSAYLIGKPVDLITDDAHLREVNIEGFATIEGQRGKFVTTPFERSDDPKYRVRSIVFSVTKN